MSDIRKDLISLISSLRLAIRHHRDQIGDYRCWVDDELLYYRFLPELRGQKPKVPPPKEFAANCEAYFNLRQDPRDANVTDLPLDSSAGRLELKYDDKVLNADLRDRDDAALQAEIDHWYQLIRNHWARGPLERTFRDDQSLYDYLPEKTRAVTKLPPRESFIERNCPAYNKHCQAHPKDFIAGTWNKAVGEQ